ncbi:MULTISPECIES: amino acid permease [unclassified Sporolactobacillus]|uniref:amino acid permease n=1 Tax=unclassified Sporolactobacillus TaxID=2628533 RepID=UPI0023680A45|nr:amino acid permease [Sporolactobacillus sp. CQH2019]MDD9147335.1 amino acid permease [Sporolactobacillus sp. CQH2019]
MSNIFKTKPIASLIAETKGKQGLKKALSAFDLTLLGIGAVIGTGIFVLTGVAAANYSGPALVISFILSGLACFFAALCYAEFSSTVPVAGSAYTYSYAALGEIWAWIIGWDLILEYAVAISAVAIGWSGYAVSLLQSIGLTLPKAFTLAPLDGGIVNLPAMLIIALIAWLLITGVRQTSNLNSAIVIIKLVVIALFIVLAVWHVKPSNWVPFMPFGFNGVVSGAAVIFFAYIGFDAVSTAAEETKNPQRDLPRGILYSLLICTALYIVVSAILTGVVKYTAFAHTSAPVAYALQQIGINWGSALVSVGAICGITSVLLVITYGQTRIFFAMARDGLIPQVFGKVSEEHQTPVMSTVLVAIVTMVTAGFLPIGIVAELANIGTLFAFIIVSIGVWVLRVRRPDLKRAFRTPWVPVVVPLAVLSCGYLVIHLQPATLLRFVVWFAIGMVVYFAYSRNHSLLSQALESEKSSSSVS